MDKAPVKRPAQKRQREVQNIVDSDDSWEEDEEPGARAPVQQVQIRHDPAAVNVAAPANANNPLNLPRELLPHGPIEYDVSDEEGEDHTGLWKSGDLEALVLGLNHYRDRLKGKYVGCAGGKDRKDMAWDKVAVYINKRCVTKWTVGQCKGKARRYCLDVKNKYNTLRRELNKTASRAIPDKMYLTKIEEMVLDYIGVEGVIGIPGIQAVPLRPDQGRDYLKLRANNATKAWDHARPTKPNYNDDLPNERIHLSKTKKK